MLYELIIAGFAGYLIGTWVTAVKFDNAIKEALHKGELP